MLMLGLIAPLVLAAEVASAPLVVTPDDLPAIRAAMNQLPPSLRCETIWIHNGEARFSICGDDRTCHEAKLTAPVGDCPGVRVSAGCVVSADAALGNALTTALNQPKLETLFKPPPLDMDADESKLPWFRRIQRRGYAFLSDMRDLFTGGSDLDGIDLDDPSPDPGPALENPGALRQTRITRARRDVFSAVWTGTELQGTKARGLADLRWLDLLLVPVFLGMLVVVLREQLRRESRWVTWALAGITLGAIALRLLVSPREPLEAWPYHRMVPAASMLFHGEILRFLSRAAHLTFYRTDLNFQVTAILAALTPLVYFGHARLLFKDVRSAVAAAALIALMPIHLRFSATDTSFVQSLVASSLCFMLIYTAASTERRGLAWACVLSLPLVCLATYFARPDAVAFYPLDLAGLYVVSRKFPRWKRLGAIFVVLTVTVALAIALNVSRLYGMGVESSLGIVFSRQTAQNVFEILRDLKRNSLLNPATMSPVIPVLMLAGFVALWRTGEKLRALFLVAWLAGFFWIDSFVAAPYPLIARYHMHLLTPVVMLAAASVPWLWTRRSWFAVAALAVVLAPVASLGFIRDTGYAEVREFHVLEKLRDVIPEGCTVLEYREPNRLRESYVSRFNRIGIRLKDGVFSPLWNVVPLTKALSDHELTKEAEALIASPPACLYFYEGLSCTHGSDASGRVPACTEVLSRVRFEDVLSETVPFREYDPGSSGAIPLPGNDVVFPEKPPLERARFVLHRALGRPASAAVPVASPAE